MQYPNLGIFDPHDQFVRGSESAYVPPFNPSNIGGLQLWLDASDTSTVATTGNHVDSWTDKSTNGYVFLPSGSGSLITYESGNYVSLERDGTGLPEQLVLYSAGAFDFMYSNGSDTQASIYFVIDQIYDVSTRRLEVSSRIFGGSDGIGNGFQLSTEYSSGDRILYKTYSGVWQYNGIAVDFDFNYKTVGGFRFGKNPGNYSSSQAKTVDTTYAGTGEWGTVHGASLNKFALFGDSVDNPFRIHELIIYDNIISDANHNIIMSYLYNKYSVNIDRRMLWESGDTIQLETSAGAWRWP